MEGADLPTSSLCFQTIKDGEPTRMVFLSSCVIANLFMTHQTCGSSCVLGYVLFVYVPRRSHMSSELTTAR
jgi:hypothetical protein